MKKKILTIIVASLSLFAGKLHIDFNNGTTSVEINFTDINSIEIVYDSPVGIVLIPSGSYMRGDHFKEGGSGELPVHQVTLNSFYMDITSVTQSEWKSVMTGNTNGISATPSHPDYGIGHNHPVNGVSWYSVLVFCNRKSMAEGYDAVYVINNSTNPADWGDVPTTQNAAWDAVICKWHANGYRLPSEAEWEYAARGGLSGQRFPNGATISHSTNGDTQANYHSYWVGGVSFYSYDVSPTTGNHPSYKGKSSPVGSFSPNGYGLYDMSGNLNEWCWDWLSSYSDSAQVNPTGPETGLYRVSRGGNWEKNADLCRVSARSAGFQYYGHYAVGFRLARTP